MKVGDIVKLTRYPCEVGRVKEVNLEGMWCIVVDFFGGHPSATGYAHFDAARIEEWSPASDDDIFDARFLNGVDYYDWWHCRYCCAVARDPRQLDHQHEPNCPVGELTRVRRKLVDAEQATRERRT